LEQVLLRRLAVFVGGWTLESAEGICSGDGLERAAVKSLLTALVDQGLVEFEGTAGSGRYWLLERVRDYARLRLEAAGEQAALAERHRDWYLELAEQAYQHVVDGEEQNWLTQLAAEADNLSAAHLLAMQTLEAGKRTTRLSCVAAYLDNAQRRQRRLLEVGTEEETSTASGRAANHETTPDERFRQMEQQIRALEVQLGSLRVSLELERERQRRPLLR
jgi:predicted ATPase